MTTLPNDWRQRSGISPDIEADPVQLNAWIEYLPQTDLSPAEQAAVIARVTPAEDSEPANENVLIKVAHETTLGAEYAGHERGIVWHTLIDDGSWGIPTTCGRNYEDMETPRYMPTGREPICPECRDQHDIVGLGQMVARARQIIAKREW